MDISRFESLLLSFSANTEKKGRPKLLQPTQIPPYLCFPLPPPSSRRSPSPSPSSHSNRTLSNFPLPSSHFLACFAYFTCPPPSRPSPLTISSSDRLFAFLPTQPNPNLTDPLLPRTLFLSRTLGNLKPPREDLAKLFFISFFQNAKNKSNKTPPKRVLAVWIGERIFLSREGKRERGRESPLFLFCVACPVLVPCSCSGIR